MVETEKGAICICCRPTASELAVLPVRASRVSSRGLLTETLWQRFHDVKFRRVASKSCVGSVADSGVAAWGPDDGNDVEAGGRLGDAISGRDRIWRLW